MALANVQAKLKDACVDAGRNPTTVTLIAVSKTQPVEKITALLDAGHFVFGENRVQEAAEKFPALRDTYKKLELHFIGHLQTNKAKEAVKYFDVIQTVDSRRLASELKNEMEKQNRKLSCFLQVNTGDEEQKGGVSTKELADLYRFCTEEANLRIDGLMCIPPAHEVPDLHFALLHKLAGQLGVKKLSMGMSADFPTAIRYGATHVRVGTALFGIREN